MDDAKKLLDSLMGNHRNASMEEAEKKKGVNFKEDNVCKHYLVGFCPRNEHLFHSTKRDLGDCDKVHSDALREEFEVHADKAKYQERYEASLREYLEGCVREADAWVARERNNAQKSAETAQKKGNKGRSSEESAKLLAEAEILAEAGDFDGSRAKCTMAEQVRKDSEKEPERGGDAEEEGEDVCDICGVRSKTKSDMAAHEIGKVHVGYVRIREKLKELRLRSWPSARKRSRSRKGDDRESGGKDREKKGRERDVDRDEKKGRERDGDRDEKKGRERDGDRDRNRKGDRDKDRRRDRDRERRRSRSR